jgi:hypothetical protein
MGQADHYEETRDKLALIAFRYFRDGERARLGKVLGEASEAVMKAHDALQAAQDRHHQAHVALHKAEHLFANQVLEAIGLPHDYTDEKCSKWCYTQGGGLVIASRPLRLK